MLALWNLLDVSLSIRSNDYDEISERIICLFVVGTSLSSVVYALGPRMDASAFAEMAIRAENAELFNQTHLYKDFELVGTVIMKAEDRFSMSLSRNQVCAYGVVVVMSNRDTSNIHVGQIVTVDCVYRGFLVEPATSVIPLPCISYMFEGIKLIQ